MAEIKLVTSDTQMHIGDYRVMVRGGHVYTQQMVAGGWEYTQLFHEQTLTQVRDELLRTGHTYIGKAGYAYYYSREPQAEEWRKYCDTKEEATREALASIQRLLKSGQLSDMDVFHLLNGNPTTGEE